MADESNTQPDSNVSTAPSDAVVPGLRYREAYQRALPAAQALALTDLIPINIDLPAAVTTALGSLPEIKELRERAKGLPEFDVAQVDELGTYARAAMHAHGEYIAASAPPAALEALNVEGLALRDLLYSDAVALSNRGLVNGAPLSDFRKLTGYKNLATDLVGLSSLLRNHWTRIGTKTAITSAELDHAEDLSERLLMAVGAREQAPAVIAEVAQLRQRMFTVFVSAYDQARRAVSFLRWAENDIERIAPSLYAGRSTRRGKSDTSEPGTTPMTPGGSLPVAPLAPVTAPPSGAPVPASSALPGLPGSSPFAGAS